MLVVCFAFIIGYHERWGVAGDAGNQDSSLEGKLTMTATAQIDLHTVVHELLGMPPGTIGEDDNLIAFGIDSIAMMRLVGRLHASGVEVSYAELGSTPTVAAWSSLVARMKGENGSETRLVSPAATESAALVADSAPFPLAPMQQAYWIGRSSSVGLGGVNAHYYVELDGARLSPERLERAVRLLQRRHDMLRVRFRNDSSQFVSRDGSWKGVHVRDLSELAPQAVTTQLAELRDLYCHLRLDVEGGELFSFALTLLPGGKSRLHINIDMLVADATSFRLLLDELAALYADANRSLPAIASSFASYLAAERCVRAEQRERGKSYWTACLRELSGPPALPTIAGNEAMQRPRLLRKAASLDADAFECLRANARHAGLTASAALTAAFAEVIAQWGESRRFVLNLPVFDRQPFVADVERIVGDFTNVCLVDVDFTAAQSFVEQATGLQQQIQRGIEHIAYSGVEVLRDLARERGLPMPAPIVFTSAVSLGDLYSRELRDTLGEPGWSSSQTPQVWLDCQVTERDGGLFVNWDVVDGLFAPDVVDSMFSGFLKLLTHLSAQAELWQRPTPALLPESQRASRAARNATQCPLPAGALHDGLFANVASRPNAPALVSNGQGTWTYAELGRRVLAAARQLRDRQVQAGTLVGVSLPPGPEAVVACLAIVCLGAVYVPVSLEQPDRRRERIWKTSGVAHVVTTPAQAAQQSGTTIDFVVLDTTGPGIAASLLPAVDPEALAYVIHTSGSTGEPKGVQISHRAALNTILDVNARVALGPGDRILGVAAADFDLSIWDIFGTLSAGATLVAIDAAGRRDPDRWASMIATHGVTIWNSVPALLEMLLRMAPTGALRTLRVALLSGDWIPVDQPSRLRKASPHCRVVALGGATEASIWSNFFEVGEVPDEWRSIPYGFPLANQRFRVVDVHGRDRPDWVPGELWIGGAGIALGYRNDPATSARSFIQVDGERWYRTGDMGRYWPDGTLEFLGRIDQQVKIRGNRIELGEVEAALSSHPSVTAVVATVLDERIAAAVVTPTGQLSTADLLTHARALLPDAMLPSIIAFFEELPLTENGKVDRAGTHARLSSQAQLEEPAAPPTGSTESTIAGIWSDVLRRPVTSRERTFFEYGGDSLRATQVASMLQERLGVDVSLRELLQAATVAQLGRLLDARTATPTAFEEGEL
jgi:amino acid adenylation domain-containing protein